MAEWRSVDDLAAVDAVGVGAVAAAVAAVIAAAVAAVVAAAAAVVDEAVVAVGRGLLHPHSLLRHYQSQNRRAAFYANLTRNHPKAAAVAEEEEERRFGWKQIHRA